MVTDSLLIGIQSEIAFTHTMVSVGGAVAALAMLKQNPAPEFTVAAVTKMLPFVESPETTTILTSVPSMDASPLLMVTEQTPLYGVISSVPTFLPE